MRTNITFLLLFLVFSLPLMAQQPDAHLQYIPESEVPSIVVENQRTLFPTKIVSQWQVESRSRFDDKGIRYVANFEVDGKTGFSASYLEDGLLLFTREIISKEIIPESIRLQVKQEFPKFELQVSDLIAIPSPPTEIYMIKLRDHNLLQTAFFDVTGVKIEKKNLPPEIVFLME